MAELKLGKKAFVPDDRDLLFAEFRVAATLPKVPSRFGHGSAYSNWKMLGNGPDSSVEPGFEGAGDCVFAGAGHETMLWNKLGGKTVTISGKNSISDYSAVTGYVIGDDNTDEGTDVRTALKYRQKTGIVDSKGNRHVIGAYLKLQPKNWNQLMEASFIFGIAGIGFEFPDSAMDQFNEGQPWTVVQGAQIEGGHYVPVVGRTSAKNGGAVTWAKRQTITQDFYETYNDETWALVSQEELKNGKNERGFDYPSLVSALADLKNVK